MCGLMEEAKVIRLYNSACKRKMYIIIKLKENDNLFLTKIERKKAKKKQMKRTRRSMRKSAKGALNICKKLLI